VVQCDSGKLWCNVTAASSVYEAVREGWNFFKDPFWQGQKPNLETLFEVSLVGDERKWIVPGKRALS